MAPRAAFRRTDRTQPPGVKARHAILGLALPIGLGFGLARSDAGPPDASSKAAQPKAKVAAATTDGRRGLDLSATRPLPDPFARAMAMLADCRSKYASVKDYTCTFQKRERKNGKLSDTHFMAMKARPKPLSLYFRSISPNAGREAIYVEGRDGDKIVAHESGWGKLLAGTMYVDPNGSMAMEENRHPITDAGIGALIDTVAKRWEVDLKPGLAEVRFFPQARVGERACTLIETIHATKSDLCQYHKICFYIDRELGLPIRFEAYDWPRRPGLEPELVEEYSYTDLKLNAGLADRDFDPKNAQYSYGRF